MAWSTQAPPPRAQDVLGGVSLQRNGVTVTAVKGNLVDHRVDVIVNTTGTDLKLDNQGVSSAILNTAGQAIQQECNRNAPSGISHGEFVVTGGHSLHCNYVYHGALPRWGSSDSVKCLKELVSSCLKKAHSHSATSIAFPAMGTGGLGYPRDKVTSMLYQEIESFASQNTGTSLTDVRIVVFHKDQQTIQAFEREIQSLSRVAAPALAPVMAPAFAPVMAPAFAHVMAPAFAPVMAPVAAPVFLPPAVSTGRYWVNKGPYTLQTQEGVTVQSIKGNIVHQQVDVVVNSTTKSLDIMSGGGVSAAISRAGGANIQHECKKACPNGVDYGEICDTSGGNLPCSYIYHSALPDWSDSNAEQELRELIDNCLEKANSGGMSTIAFPAIGTGGQNYPHDKVAAVMFDQIREFSENASNLLLTDIRIVLYEKDARALRAFDSEIKKLSGTPLAPLHARPSPFKKHKMHSVPLPVAKVTPGVIKPRVNVLVVQGDITQETTQAIVNSTTENMSMEAEVSKAILKSAGQSFQDEVNQLAKAGNIGEIAITIGGNLQCSHVIHAVIPRIDHSGAIDIPKWNRLISMCLTRAESLGLQSVSFPALGTVPGWEIPSTSIENRIGFRSIAPITLGNSTCKMGNDPNQMAEILLNGIYVYLRTGAVRTLQTIRVVVYDSQNVQIYSNALQAAKSGRSANLLARASSTPSLPTTWTPMMPHVPMAAVSLNPSDSEYQAVAKNFMNSLASVKRTIVKIERIQNPRTYHGYQNEKHYATQINGSGVKCERKLWHGTAIDAINDINATSFNRSYCGKNATAYGQGVYFALNAHYSDQDQYSKPDSNGLKYMYQSLVITGSYVQGVSSMKVPPSNPAKSAVKYDSVVDNVRNPTIFVVFYDTKAYPEYLITYKK